ncbi:pentapeptide repeat-containing protein [Microbacterium keratanolyticum]
MASATALRRRWNAVDIDDIRAQLVTQQRISKPPHTLTSRWPRTDAGLVDLRGIDAGSMGIDIRYVTLQGLDLSHARGALRTFEAELTDCHLDGVTLTGQPHLGRLLERCSFRDAKLSRASIGPKVIDVDFTRVKAARLRSVPNSAFERCTFDGADLSGAQFDGAKFIDCTFADVVFSASTTFTRCEFVRTPVVFSPAQVTRCTVDGVVLADQWDGEAEADAALERYAKKYARAVRSGDAEEMALDAQG